VQAGEDSCQATVEAVCPLCQSKELSRLDEICLRDLDELFRQRFDLPVAEEFESLDHLVLYSCLRCHLRHFHPLVGGSQLFYQRLNRNRWYYIVEKREYQSAAAVIAEGATVLDIGCGEGAFARWIPSCRYVGLEMNRLKEREPRENLPVILAEGIKEHALAHQESYDVVCFFQVLEHVVDISGFLEQSIRCLRPGGKLIVSVPAADSFVGQTVNGLLNLPPHHVTWWSDESLLYLGQKYELKLESMTHEPLERMHYRRYAFNWALSLLSRRVGYRLRLIDRSLGYRILSFVVLPFALCRWGLLLLTTRAVAGHSVVAVFHKAK
jgi:SAM-dependent methyltransferase